MRIVKLPLLILILMLSISIQSYGTDQKLELTHDVKNLSDWIIATEDNQNLPFIIIDKKETKVFVFHSDGKLYGSTVALVGTTIGDDLLPGVGKKKIADIHIEERTTQAGRFEAQLGQNLSHSGMLWIDYDSGLSMHPVVTSNAYEHRLLRLASIETADHRITYGCINVSDNFYKEFVDSSFKNGGGIVYILPEQHSILKIFGPQAYTFSLRE